MTDQYIPPEANPIENAQASWTRLREEYMRLVNTNRHLESEIGRKDGRIADLETTNARLQADRDLAVVTATELKAGLIQGGDLFLNLMYRANGAFRKLRGPDPEPQTQLPEPGTERDKPVSPGPGVGDPVREPISELIARLDGSRSQPMSDHPLLPELTTGL